VPFLGFIIIELIRSVGPSFSEPAILAYAFEWVRTPERGRASAISEFCRDFGTIVGLPVVGFIYWALGPLYTFYYAAIVGVITYIAVWILWKPAPPLEELGK
jgi:sugar phosphate permease